MRRVGYNFHVLDRPASPAEELQEAGERLLREVMVVAEGGHANVRGMASSEAVQAAEAALNRYDAQADDAADEIADEIADAIRSLLPIVHEMEHPEWDEKVERLMLALHYGSGAIG
jgi:hypothetical protein